jgi:hypothetical protein
MSSKYVPATTVFRSEENGKDKFLGKKSPKLEEKLEFCKIPRNSG